MILATIQSKKMWTKIKNSYFFKRKFDISKLSSIEAPALTGCQGYIIISNPASGKFLTQCSSKITIDSMYNIHSHFFKKNIDQVYLILILLLETDLHKDGRRTLLSNAICPAATGKRNHQSNQQLQIRKVSNHKKLEMVCARRKTISRKQARSRKGQELF